MESRWYVPPGRVLKTTKIKDRKHELHVSKENWNKVTAHLDRNRLMQEALDAEEQKKQAMRETAEAMTRNWTDCLKNIKDKELPDSEDKLTENLELYKNLRKEQEEERRIYVEEMRKKMAARSDYPQALNSALLLSEVIYERDRQIELEKKLKEHAREEEAKYAEKVRKDAGDEAREKKEQVARETEKSKTYARELKEMIDANQRERADEYRDRIEREKKENAYASNEDRMMKENERKRILENREEKMRENLRQLKQVREYKVLRKNEEDEFDAFTTIIRNYKDRIASITKQREIEAKNARMERVNEAGEKLLSEKFDYDEDENQRIKRYVAKKDVEFEVRRKSEMEKRKQEKEMLSRARNDYNDKISKEQAREKEIKKWQMLNNCKAAEETRKFEEGLRKKIKDKGRKNKLDWDADLEYKKSIKEIEAEEERKGVAEVAGRMQKEDEYFYEYAREVADFARSRGRITYPIESVVKEYKRNVQKQLPEPKPCAPSVNKDLLNTTPGRMSHDPKTDPTYHNHCKCGCHKDTLYK